MGAEKKTSWLHKCGPLRRGGAITVAGHKFMKKGEKSYVLGLNTDGELERGASI